MKKKVVVSVILTEPRNIFPLLPVIKFFNHCLDYLALLIGQNILKVLFMFLHAREISLFSGVCVKLLVTLMQTVEIYQQSDWG